VPLALAWSDTYVSNATWYAGSHAHSGFNYHLQGNAINWSDPQGGAPQMGSCYVNANLSCVNSFQWSNTGTLTDYRTVSYGAANCKANTGNNYPVYIYYCYTNN
jgi:hypothetical protein